MTKPLFCMKTLIQLVPELEELMTSREASLPDIKDYVIERIFELGYDPEELSFNLCRTKLDVKVTPLNAYTRHVLEELEVDYEDRIT